MKTEPKTALGNAFANAFKAKSMPKKHVTPDSEIAEQTRQVMKPKKK